MFLIFDVTKGICRAAYLNFGERAHSSIVVLLGYYRGKRSRLQVSSSSNTVTLLITSPHELRVLSNRLPPHVFFLNCIRETQN